MRTLIFLSLVACAPTTTSLPARPHGELRASEYLSQAHADEQLVRDHQTWPSTQVLTPGSTEPLVLMPWLRTRDIRAERRSARLHRAQAAALEAEYERACGDAEAPTTVRCHRAWMRLAPTAIEDTPLANQPESGSSVRR
jgi:hypothetical protein